MAAGGLPAPIHAAADAAVKSSGGLVSGMTSPGGSSRSTQCNRQE
jgi:hypothetical protein